jgi:hypothetical protein
MVIKGIGVSKGMFIMGIVIKGMVIRGMITGESALSRELDYRDIGFSMSPK